MTKQLLAIAAIAALVTLPSLNAPARAGVCPGVSASISATATVLEPVGVIVLPDASVRPAAGSISACSLRLPPARDVLIQLCADGLSPATVARTSDTDCVQKLDPNLLHKYDGGTITVIFPND